MTNIAIPWATMAQWQREMNDYSLLGCQLCLWEALVATPNGDSQIPTMTFCVDQPLSHCPKHGILLQGGQQFFWTFLQSLTNFVVLPRDCHDPIGEAERCQQFWQGYKESDALRHVLTAYIPRKRERGGGDAQPGPA